MLFNKTKNKEVIAEIRHAKNFSSKLKGLMFKKKFDYGLVFYLREKSRRRASIHMMFVFTPIDVVYLDENRIVVDKVEWLRPWTINYTPKMPALYFIELPPGKSEQIDLGDQLDWN